MKTENRRFKHYSIVLNDERFQVVGKLDNSYNAIERDDRWTYSNIWMAYGKPSQTKENIWNYWDGWRAIQLENNVDITIWIQSKNCHFFTICGKVRYTDNETGELKAYFLHITASHNYAYEIEP